ncbi:MAG: T9SS type A sorting domain-containing protein, partial [Candidatus Eisenbacteria bacterium]
VYQATMMDIVAGADVVWLWHADGTAPIDADGTSVSHGDFTTRGSYYAAGPSLARLDQLNWSIIAPSWDSLRVYVFDKQGNVRSGWPFPTADPVWSGVAVGDLNNDDSNELVFASNGTRFYVLRANGTEWMDGDSNPATLGVFKVLGTPYNYGTPALADLDNNGQLDIIYAAFDGKLYAWRPDGSNLPNFPVNIGAGTTSSVAVGYLDGPGDTQLDIVVTSANDSLYVFKADGGRHAGFPVGIRFQGTNKNPSPALADMNADGFVDVVAASTDGKIYVYDHNGTPNPSFISARYSALTDGYASESSPVVADINGDGLPDVVMGDENGILNGISGNGQLLPGFPIQLGGEVRGTPAVCDCDGDGKSEIVVSSWDQNTYVWDYDFAFSPAGTPPWPQFHHDARRSGLATAPAFVDAPSPELPPAPLSVELAPPVPNPAHTTTRLAWAVPVERAGADLDLSVYDLAGRRIVRLASGKAQPGRFAVDWDLRSAGGTRMGSGIYFLRFHLGPFTESRKLVVMP